MIEFLQNCVCVIRRQRFLMDDPTDDVLRPPRSLDHRYRHYLMSRRRFAKALGKVGGGTPNSPMAASSRHTWYIRCRVETTQVETGVETLRR